MKYKNFVLNIMTLFVLVFHSMNGYAADLPLDVIQKVHRIYPDAKILVSSSCKLGEAHLESLGLIIKLTNSHLENPLKALVLVNVHGNWELNEVPQEISNSRGGDADFLSDFWSEKGVGPSLKVRCTNPLIDEDINVSANGEFIDTSFEKNSAIKHLCFSASNIYNNWVCLTTPLGSYRPIVSFVQLNAD